MPITKDEEKWLISRVEKFSNLETKKNIKIPTRWGNAATSPICLFNTKDDEKEEKAPKKKMDRIEKIEEKPHAKESASRQMYEKLKIAQPPKATQHDDEIKVKNKKWVKI